ncbi:hypothetical protein Cni_G23914 [Canna indica]|uniref:Late embryogenesis abundant protein LEA-2 subgroup domain-containing protein n=1 Tax=Canna indica TaxID=4628 RepID=A0AAQ3QMN8_9LILI|nr:hypothetical protein Cni_G23914 [Canna indica]
MGRTKSQRGPQLCCFALLLLLVILIILYFAVFKPREPDVEATIVGLRQIEFQPSPNFALNITLDVDVTIDNPNFAAFKFDAGTTLIYYRGALVGEAPVMAGEISARSTETMRASVELQVSAMAANPAFVPDVTSGTLTLQSSTSLEGKVTVLGIFRRRASTFTYCDIFVFLFTSTASANCRSKVNS